jgi:hypothetical protein
MRGEHAAARLMGNIETAVMNKTLENVKKKIQ